MTKRELIEMLQDVNDNEEITFVTELRDRDGFPFDSTEKIYKVIGGATKTVTDIEYGVRVKRIYKAWKKFKKGGWQKPPFGLIIKVQKQKETRY